MLFCTLRCPARLNPIHSMQVEALTNLQSPCSTPGAWDDLENIVEFQNPGHGVRIWEEIMTSRKCIP